MAPVCSNPGLDCEQSLFCSKIPAGGAARKRVRYSSREPRAASSVGWRVSSVCSKIPAGGSARKRVRYSSREPLEYRPRDFAVHPARILEQKRDCSQSNPGPNVCNFICSMETKLLFHFRCCLANLISAMRTIQNFDRTRSSFRSLVHCPVVVGS